jgi:hypothetical protein
LTPDLILPNLLWTKERVSGRQGRVKDSSPSKRPRREDGKGLMVKCTSESVEGKVTSLRSRQLQFETW